MALTLSQQITDRINQSHHHLVVFRADAAQGKTQSSKDAIASSLALAQFLRQQGKIVDVACDGFTNPGQLRYLSGLRSVRNTLPAIQKSIITVDVSKSGIESLSYDVQNEQLSIFVTPKHQQLSATDVQVNASPYLYDCIWIVDSHDLGSLGNLYLQHTDLFHNVPTIVIDHAPSNEHFGTINLIDLTATSTAEVLYNLFEQTARKEITPEIATALLTGIIAKTKSFKSNTMKPQTFARVSALMELGAKRDVIVDHLFRQRPIATLKLWGSVLTRMHHDAKYNMITVTIPQDEFTRTGAHEHDLPEIIDELLINSPEAGIIALIYQSPITKKFRAIVHTKKPFDARELLAQYQPTGNRDLVECHIDASDLTEAQRVITKILHQNLAHTTI